MTQKNQNYFAGFQAGSQQKVTGQPQPPVGGQPQKRRVAMNSLSQPPQTVVGGGQPLPPVQQPPTPPIADPTFTLVKKAKVKWPWWKKALFWLEIAIALVFLSSILISYFGMKSAREAERAELLAALEAAQEEVLVEPQPEEEEIILDSDVSFVGEEGESIPESTQQKMSDGSVILDSSVTEVSHQIHGEMPRAIATSAKKVSGGVEVNYTFQNLPEYGEFEIVVGLWNSWPGQEYPVVEKTTIQTQYPGTVFVEITEQEWSKVNSVLISARGVDRDWEAAGTFHQLSELWLK